MVIVGEAAQLALSAEGGPTTARRSVARENRSSARQRRKCVAGALAEIEVGAFEALESCAPEFKFCKLLGLAKAGKLRSSQAERKPVRAQRQAAGKPPQPSQVLPMWRAMTGDGVV